MDKNQSYVVFHFNQPKKESIGMGVRVQNPRSVDMYDLISFVSE